MFCRLSCLALTLGLAFASGAFAQHADVEFGYDDTGNPSAFVIEQPNVTLDGIQYFESAMEELDPFNPGDFSSDEPGFATNDAENLLINSNDRIFLQALDASAHSSFGVGFVNYYNPNTNQLTAIGRISVIDNSSGTANLVLNGGSIESGVNPQFLGLGDSLGDLHDHVVFDLLNDSTAPLGAYGVLLRMQSDFDVADGNMDLSSEPFWIIFNHGMSAEDFDDLALPAFGISAIPEPGSLLVLGLASAALGLRRRRR